MANKGTRPANPFFTGIIIPDRYFCDREQETKTIIDLIENGNNVVLKAQRRIGKSSLVHHIFNQKKVLNDYNTLYIDLFGTKNYNDFHIAFQNKLINAPFARTAKIKRNFEQILKGINVSLGSYDPATGQVSLPSIGTTPAQMPRIPLEELFGFLETTKKKNLIVFDEFQQIEYYPERMAAILRSHIQQMNNTKFIFSGSSKHMLNMMFMNHNKPFYKSSSNIDLDILDYDKYESFVSGCFEEYGKSIAPEAIRFVYDLFLGETAPMQETMNHVFGKAGRKASAGIPEIKESVAAILESKDESFRTLLNGIEKEKTRNTLYCIAAQGIASNLTSSRIMKDYALDNASSVQNALISLQDDNNPIVRKLTKGTYIIDDRMFELWIAREGNYLDIKFETANDRHQRQRALERPSFQPTAPKS
jgi:AAA+ ATPase superfamily predicted ATPase